MSEKLVFIETQDHGFLDGIEIVIDIATHELEPELAALFAKRGTPVQFVVLGAFRALESFPPALHVLIDHFIPHSIVPDSPDDHIGNVLWRGLWLFRHFFFKKRMTVWS